VARAYYLVVSQKEVVTALQNKVKVDEKHLAAAKARFEVGQSPRSEVLRADLVATQDKQQLRTQTNTLHAARRQLALLVGLKGSVDVKRPAEPASTDGEVGQALAVRHDYQATDVAIKLARQGKDTVWWGFLPLLDLSWLYRWSETEGFAGERGAWQLMFTLNVPIYDGGVRYANLREASAKLREAESQRRALALQIESEIVKLRSDVESANAGVVSARKALELAKTTASDMEVSFEAGAVTQLDVLDANQRLLDAELALTAQIFQRDLARLALTHALGKFDPEAK
jgi:outer membrane protein TolC